MFANALIVLCVAAFCAIALVGHILLLVAVRPKRDPRRGQPQHTESTERGPPALGSPISGENFR